MKRLIIVGSPRAQGRSAHLAEMLFEANIDEHPEDELFLVPVSEVEIGPCIGCNGCREKSGVILKGDDGKEVTVQRHRCVFDDDMQALYDIVDDVDELTVVSPVYFSGAPAQLKCLYDRLQPYYWERERGKEKRPASLHIIGEGGDPHGYDALVSETRSALAVAGFRLERVLDWVGKIDEQGEITAEAKQIACDEGEKTARPKLSLSNAGQGAKSGGPSSSRSADQGAGARSGQKRNARHRNDRKRNAPAKGASGKGGQAKGAQAKGRRAQGASGKGGQATDAPAKGASGKGGQRGR